MNFRGRRGFCGWWVVATAATGLFWGAPITVFSFSVFFKPLMHDFHVGRAAISLAFTLGGLAAAISAPLAGWLTDRCGARKVILPATVMFGSTLLLAKVLSASIGQFYVLYLLLGLLVNGVGPVPYSYVISHWFDRRRGLALGLTMFGIGSGAMVIPVAAQMLIAKFGWRSTYALFGCAVLLISLPIVAVFLKENPADWGLLPDGAEPRSAPALEPAGSPGRSLGEVWQTQTFWLMVCPFFLAGASVHGCAVHLVALLSDRGMSMQTAALGSSILGAAVLIGRAGTGFLLDHVFAPCLAAVCFAGVAAGIALLRIGNSTAICFVGAFLVGLGLGAEVDMIAFLVSRYFGLRFFGQIYGFAFAAFALAGALGPVAMGAGFDFTGSYTAPLAGLCISGAAAALLISRLGPYQYETAGAEQKEQVLHV
jgi:predicted MFS family arabinose efflux permease